MSVYQRFYHIVRDNQGNVISGATCTVYNVGTDTLSTIYDPGSDDSNPQGISNPFVTGADGKFGFFALDGEYDIQIKGGSLATQTFRVTLSTADAGVGAVASADLANTSSLALGDALVGVKQPFAGSLVMTQHTKNQQRLDLTDFDGVDITGTTDSTAGIQAAVTALGGVSGVLHCIRGTLRIDGTITCHVGCSFDFDGTTLDISHNTNAEVFSYNTGYAGATIFQAAPTFFRGCRVNGKSDGTNSTTYLWLINRMPYFFPSDVTVYYSLLAHIVGDAIVGRFNKVKCYYMPAGDLVLMEQGAVATWGPNGWSYTCGYIEQSYVAGCTAFHVKDGSMDVKDTYIEAINTISKIENGAGITFEGCSLGLRPSVLWRNTPGVMQICDILGNQGGIRLTNTVISVGLYTSWSAYLFFVEATAPTASPFVNIQFENVQLINASSSSATELTIFKLRAPLTGAINGSQFYNAAAACRMNIFDTGNASYTSTVNMQFTGSSFAGEAYATGNPDSINWELNGQTSGPGYNTSTLTGCNFKRVTNFTKQSLAVITGCKFSNQQALIYTDHATVSLRSLIELNSFDMTPVFTNLGLVQNNAGVPNTAASGFGGPVASATTITPTGPIFRVTGTTTIQTIASTPYPRITLLPAGVFALGVSGNIAAGSTSVVGKALDLVWDAKDSVWFPSY